MQLGISPIAISLPSRIVLYICVLGMLYLGLFPNTLVNLADRAVVVLSLTH